MTLGWSRCQGVPGWWHLICCGTHHGTGKVAQPQEGEGEVDAVAGDGIVLHRLVHGHPDPPLQGSHVQPSLPPEHLGRAPCPQEVALAMLSHYA